MTGERSFTYTVSMSTKQYAKIMAFYEQHRRMPTYSEIMRLMAFKSKNSAYKLVNTMAEKGLIEKDSSGRVIPRQLTLPVRVLGTVEAGFPSPAEEELSDTMTLDEYLIEKREATYLLKVSGDSMIDAGIVPGDLVLVERGKDPKAGDIVIAEVDHAWTMKYFQKVNGKITLVAANKHYPPIVPKDELKIAAVVKAVVRKY